MYSNECACVPVYLCVCVCVWDRSTEPDLLLIRAAKVSKPVKCFLLMPAAFVCAGLGKGIGTLLGTEKHQHKQLYYRLYIVSCLVLVIVQFFHFYSKFSSLMDFWLHTEFLFCSQFILELPLNGRCSCNICQTQVASCQRPCIILIIL